MDLRGFGRWLFVEPLPAWSAIGVPVVTLLVSLLLPMATELSVRIAGYALTVVGIILAVKGILEKTRLFDRPSVFSRTRAWIGRLSSFFRRREPRVISVHAGSGGISIVGGDADIRVSLGPGAALEERIAVLERDLNSLRERVKRDAQKLHQQVDEIRTSHAKEASEIKETTEKLRTRLEELSVGSLDLELSAIVWVVFGNLYTTFPQEIAGLFGGV